MPTVQCQITSIIIIYTIFRTRVFGLCIVIECKFIFSKLRERECQNIEIIQPRHPQYSQRGLMLSALVKSSVASLYYKQAKFVNPIIYQTKPFKWQQQALSSDGFAFIALSNSINALVGRQFSLNIIPNNK
ncbi:hypothetical protein FGO68_gene7756 [Halteria grandinella]|uniref:Uncharacterized protein n=1 Tax=Halteria grandinella TaxID=5974 RepID=A0A8J8SXK9_HALGN|nr:hypothetical protein FGO68_gene7756 [Halteria grandinella]